MTVEHFLLMRIPRRFWGVTFDQIQPPLRDIVRNYLKEMDTRLDRGEGLLFWGKNGRGKTSVASFVAREVRRSGASVLMITAASLIESVMEKTQVEEGLLLDRARSVDFLLLDDLGKEHPGRSGFADRILENLLRERSAAHLTTFITSNMDYEELCMRYAASMMEVLKETVLPVKVRGENFRDEAREELSKAVGVV